MLLRGAKEMHYGGETEMQHRRTFLSKAAAMASIGTAMSRERAISASGQDWAMPDESHPHRRTWMAFGAQKKIWGKRLLPHVRANLALIAKTISRFEPVSLLVRSHERELAAEICGDTVDLIEAPLDDVWIRDMGPTFVLNQAGGVGGVDLNFNGWGKKQAHANDAKVAVLVTQHADAQLIATKLVGEGGGIEVDGHGTAIVTESCFVNRNRNPRLSKEDCDTLLKMAFGLRKVIWLPGIRGKDITDGHTDFYARFAGKGVVVAGLETDRSFYDYKVTREHLDVLSKATDADGEKLEVVPLESPQRIRPDLKSKDFAAGYINFYVINGAVIMPEFGDDQADLKAQNILKGLFASREVVALNIDAIAAGGGGIHCVTQQEPRP